VRLSVSGSRPRMKPRLSRAGAIAVVILGSGIAVWLAAPMPALPTLFWLFCSTALVYVVLRQQEGSLERAEDALASERGRFRLIFDHGSDAAVLHDARGRLVDVNEGALATYGYDRETFLSVSVDQLSAGRPPYSRPEARQWFQRALAGEQLCFDWQARNRDGQLFWVEVRLRRLVLDGAPHLLATLRDINERKRSEALIRQSEQRFRGLFEHTPMVAVQGYDHARRAIYWNRASEELYGWRTEEALGRPMEELIVPPAERASTIAEIEHWLAGGAPPSTGEMSLIDRHGAPVRVYSSHVLQQAADGALEMYFVDVDLRELSRAVEAVHGREQEMQLAAESTLALLRNPSVAEAIPEVLAQVGRGMQVDRVYLFEVHDDGHGTGNLCTMRFEWVHQGISAEIDNPEMRNLPMEQVLPHWLPEWRLGRSVGGDTGQLPQPERGILEAQSIQSVLVVPVLFNQRFWGFLGFDSVRSQRTWSATEDSVLRIIGAALATAIERQRVEEQLRQNAKVFESTRDGVVITDLDGRIVSVNAAFCAISGYSTDEVLGRSPDLLKSGRQSEAFFADLWASLRDTGHWQGEVWNRRKNGEIYPQWLSISTVHDERGQASHYVGVGTDISQLKRSEEQLQHLAHHDPLTGLPNRLLAQSRLEHALSRAQRNNLRMAVVFLDLDGFKHVNDSLGHPVGDIMLSTIADRLRQRVRADDTLARLGGDEFLLIIDNVEAPADVATVARKLLDALQQPLTLEGRELYVTASIGISLFPDDGQSWSELIRNADTAMYQAKAAGRDRFCFYTADMNANALAQLELEASLRQALGQDRFELHYQPKADLASGRTVGFEALLRLRDPQGGLLPPDSFIPMAERSGLIVPIGAWVLQRACLEAVAWHAAGRTDLTVAVNVSACQFRCAEFAEHVAHALQASGLPAAALELELTESVLMDDPERTAERLLALKRTGVRLSLDDFGTGYSSLGYLMRFPIDALKIDRSFVAGMGRDRHATDIINSIIGLARRMRLRVVAEGVELDAQLQSLRAYGCDEIQGFLLSRPMPADACNGWLRREDEPVAMA
jgi:diguanylate cyclase (GGDEF)-like protein/PAS domain S-box-containing protein